MRNSDNSKEYYEHHVRTAFGLPSCVLLFHRIRYSHSKKIRLCPTKPVLFYNRSRQVDVTESTISHQLTYAT